MILVRIKLYDADNNILHSQELRFTNWELEFASAMRELVKDFPATATFAIHGSREN